MATQFPSDSHRLTCRNASESMQTDFRGGELRVFWGRDKQEMEKVAFPAPHCSSMDLKLGPFETRWFWLFLMEVKPILNDHSNIVRNKALFSSVFNNSNS
ncbi:hypothetical protein CJ030_MR5G020281 [Morella rubra]|uniref:Uncharacterized protein n=1 Tax=Morella rubra TaxID=262757 RepID=A0A6A1VSJ8_9ROSI|nr:hypothetical protein CJ030_MR5G020281 [Morella rubra]